MSNVSTHELPITLIEAIQSQKNISKVFFLSKGSSQYLYVIAYMQDENEVYNIVTYGDTKITDYLKDFYSKSVEDLNYGEKSAFQKLKLFIETLFDDYSLDFIEVVGNRLSLEDDIDEFLKSIS